MSIDSSVVYTIAAHHAFMQQLAKALLQRHDGEMLARVIVLLPSRRAIRSLQEAFLRESQGKALMLPQMVSLADLDEAFVLRHASLTETQKVALETLSHVPSDMERLMHMQKLVWAYGQKTFPRLHRASAAFELAQNLLAVMDEVDQEQGDWQALDHVVPHELASHWQQTLEFLKIIRQYWPALEKACGWMSPWQRRNKLLEIVAESWQHTPPTGEIIVAGVNGALPAAAKLIRVLSQLPQGKIILPGYEPAYTAAEPLPEHHPHALMQRLAQSFSQISCQPLGPEVSDQPFAVKHWLSQALLPVEQLHQWQQSLSIQDALSTSRYLQAETQQDLAQLAALLMREVLDKPHRTCALITPDRQLARAVKGQLVRWNIEVDDSAGQPLAQTPAAIFLFLLLDVLTTPFDSVTLLALWKHPYFRMGCAVSDIRREVRKCEKLVLREMLDVDWQKLQEAELTEWYTRFCKQLQPVLQVFSNEETEQKIPFMLTTLLQLAEKMSQDEAGESFLWKAEGAEDLSDFLQELIQAADTHSLIANELPATLRVAMQGRVVRPRYGMHPRIFILSSLEARLQRFDRVVLADMNEGCWPQTASPSPWMNRQMRQKMGLPSIQQHIGQQAHDWLQHAQSEEVFFLRSQRQGGAPTMPSRFIMRLLTYTQSQATEQEFSEWQYHPALQWLKQWQQPEAVAAAKRPQPCPPMEARPRRLSVTQIERLRRDPYSIYANKILKLKPLNELLAMPSHREFGQILHKILEESVRQRRPFSEIMERELQHSALPHSFQQMWRPRLQKIGEWIVNQPWPEQMLVEITGKWCFATPQGEFTLTAKADRLDIQAGGVAVIDYKTGTVPSTEVQKLGYAVQLPLTAAIIQQGGFEMLSSVYMTAMQYWKLGGKEGGEVKSAYLPKGIPPEEWIEHIAQELQLLIAAYDDIETPYTALPNLRYAPTYNEYEQLARKKEWAG